MKRDWITDRLNKCRWDGGGSNDDAYDTQERRRGALPVERVYINDEPKIESHFDEERNERERGRG